MRGLSGGGRGDANPDLAELLLQILESIARLNDDESLVQPQQQRVPARPDCAQSGR